MADTPDPVTSLIRRFTSSTHEGPAPSWAVLELHGSYPDQSRVGMRGLVGGVESRQQLADKVKHLAGTDRFSHVLVRVGDLNVGVAAVDEIAAMLGRLAEKKQVVAYVPNLTARTLLLTRHLPELVTPPSGAVMVHGMALEQTFLASFLRDRGIAFEVERIGAYKSTWSAFTDEEMGEADREQFQAYLDAAQARWVSDVASARGLEEATVSGWLSADLVEVDQALQAGMISRVAYEDEIVRIDPKARTSALEFVLPRAAKAGGCVQRLLKRGGKEGRVALVRVDGAIMSGRSRPATPLQGPISGSDTVIEQLRTAKADEQTKAIVLAVDSGGGAATASDLISREVATAQVPVVAVMENVAASGGYYVAARADEIFASPYTLTGSIGVVVGRPVIRELMERWGLRAERLGDERALTFSPTREWRAEDREWIRGMVDVVYRQFVTGVAAGRGKTFEEIDALARGRIWVGTDAVTHGLVDTLGTPEDALRRARELAGLDEDAPVWRPRPVRGPLSTIPEVGHDPASWIDPFAHEPVLTALAPMGPGTGWRVQF